MRAEALKIDTSMLAKIEKAQRKPSKAFIEKSASYFGVQESKLHIAFLSDTVAYQIKDEEDAIEVLKVAEEKVKYLRSNENPQPWN